MKKKYIKYILGLILLFVLPTMILLPSARLQANKNKKPSSDATIIEVLKFIEESFYEPEKATRLIIYEPTYESTLRYGLEGSFYHLGVRMKGWIACFQLSANLLNISGKTQPKVHGLVISGKKKGTSLPVLDTNGNTACSGTLDNPTLTGEIKHKKGFIKYRKLQQIYKKKNKIFSYENYDSEW